MSRALYDTLEVRLLPLFYEQGAAWTRVMQRIAFIASVFNRHWAVRQYVLYLNAFGDET